MTSSKPDLVLVGPQKPVFIERLAPVFDIHSLNAADDRDAFFARVADRVRAIAVTYSSEKVSAEFMSRLPKLEIVSSFGVGYDHVDAKWAGAHGIIVTNTPDVLNEEVADTALGLLLCTVREFPQAERYLRAGKWEQKAYNIRSPRRRYATAPSEWSAWGGSAGRSRGGSIQPALRCRARRKKTGAADAALVRGAAQDAHRHGRQFLSLPAAEFHERRTACRQFSSIAESQILIPSIRGIGNKPAQVHEESDQQHLPWRQRPCWKRNSH
jgi:hypothetical protein